MKVLKKLPLRCHEVNLCLLRFHLGLKNVRRICLSHIRKLVDCFYRVHSQPNETLPYNDHRLGGECAVKGLRHVVVNSVGLLFNTDLIGLFLLVVDIAA